MLLLNGGSATAVDGRGRTPLHLAAWQGSAAAVEELVRYGARTDAQDADGRTPLEFSGLHVAAEEALKRIRADELRKVPCPVERGRGEQVDASAATSHRLP